MNEEIIFKEMNMEKIKEMEKNKQERARVEQGERCALASSELTGSKSPSISLIVLPIMGIPRTQFIAALAFSTKWTDKLQKKKGKQGREGQANTTPALKSVGDMARNGEKWRERPRGREGVHARGGGQANMLLLKG